MKPFGDIIREWQPFYSALAAACATLTGLLFVALSINGELLRRKENAELMMIAQMTFGEFLMVLVVSLMFLIPHQAPIGLSTSLIVLGGIWTVSAILAARARRRLIGV